MIPRTGGLMPRASGPMLRASGTMYRVRAMMAVEDVAMARGRLAVPVAGVTGLLIPVAGTCFRRSAVSV